MALALEKARKNRRIGSFTTNAANSVMWTHYADNHKGICIGMRTGSLSNLSAARQVIYKKTIPIWKGEDYTEEKLDEVVLTRPKA